MEGDEKKPERRIKSATFQLVSRDVLHAGQQLANRFVECCNEPNVYQSLFAELCGGLRYTPDHALAWLDWAIDGWKDGKHFVFLAWDIEGLPVAACDIKNCNREDAEIGCWRSKAGRGTMTACVASMLTHAVANGFNAFQAYVRPENVRSAALLSRVGFLRDAEKDDDIRFAYSLRSLALKRGESPSHATDEG